MTAGSGQDDADPGDADGDCRFFVVMYLVLLGLFAFRYDVTGSNGKPIQQPATTGTLIHSFTLLMATILAFYFATTAAEHISSDRNVDRRQRREHEERIAAAKGV